MKTMLSFSLFLLFVTFGMTESKAAQNKESTFTQTSSMIRLVRGAQVEPGKVVSVWDEMNRLAQSLPWDNISWEQVKSNLHQFLGCAPAETVAHSRLTRASWFTNGRSKVLLVHDRRSLAPADEIYLNQDSVIKRFFVQLMPDQNSLTGKVAVVLLVLPEDDIASVKTSDLDRRGYWFYKSLLLGGFQCVDAYGGPRSSFKTSDYYLTAYPQGMIELAEAKDGRWLNTQGHTLVFKHLTRPAQEEDVPLPGLRFPKTDDFATARWVKVYPVSNAEYRTGFKFWKDKFTQSSMARQESYDTVQQKLQDARRERKILEKSGNRSIATRFTIRRLRLMERYDQRKLRDMDGQAAQDLSLIDDERDLLGD